jgi:hypothetical protein
VKALRPAQPIIVLLALALVLILLITAVRAISAGAGFLVERQVVLIVWLAGLLIAGAIFAWVVRRSMRRDASRSELWFLASTGIVLASPLALILLQHPAR